MIHIQRFLDRIKFLQQQNSKEYTVSLHEARNLHMDITKLLLELKKHQDGTSSDEAISVELKGEDF